MFICVLVCVGLCEDVYTQHLHISLLDSDGWSSSPTILGIKDTRAEAYLLEQDIMGRFFF